MDDVPDNLMQGLRFLRRELAPFPWRINLALRCVLASAIVIVVSMTLEVPALALSLIVVFYTTQSNVVITRLAGILFMLAATLAVCMFLLLLIFAMDHPLLRIVGASLVLFISAYLMRILKVGTMFFIVAIVVIYLQSLIDQMPAPELMLRLTLWVWVVVNYAIAVTLIVNTLLLPIEPAQQLKDEIRRQLEAVDAALLRLEQGAAPVQEPEPARLLANTLTLQKLLKFAAMRDKKYRADEAYQLALIASVSHLGRAASELPALPEPSVRQLRAQCAALDTAVQANTRYRLTSAVPAASDGIDEMWHTLAALSALGLQHGPPQQKAKHEDPMVTPDAFTNPAYVRFALKTTLAVLIAYVFYNAVNWQGIHTIMLTCLIVALPSLGASTQKVVLRVGGALVGSALALFAVVFVIPRIDTIFGLLLMALPVIGLGAWIAAGSERISYAGIQVMFTFALAVLESFRPTTNLTEIRDRMVGILLGVLLAVATQTLIWPEGEGLVLRRKLAGLFRTVAAMVRSDVSAGGDAAQLAYLQRQMQAWAEFGATRAMLARVALEPDWYESMNELVTARAQAVLASVEQIIRADNALVAMHGPAPPVRAAVADELERYADALQAEPPVARKPSWQELPLDAAAAELVRHLCGLPDWAHPAPAHAAAGAPLRP